MKNKGYLGLFFWLLIAIVPVASDSDRKLSAADLIQRLESSKGVRILDVRSEKQREVEGFVSGSELLSINDDGQYGDGFGPIPDDERDVILVTEAESETLAAAKIAEGLGHQDFFCYTEGMAKYQETGGDIEYPRFVQFEALSQLLNEKKVLLIDVRNRSELNEVGQIPGSVCLPLHEVDLAFGLSPEEFLDRYQFPKPVDPTRQDIILTCRSGRRVLVADRILKAKGFNKLRIYSGSFKDWVKNNGEVIQGSFDLDYEILA